MLRDYLAPLRDVPAGKGFSYSGRLLGGPSTLRVYPPKDQLQTSRGTRFAVVGALASPAKPQTRLNWFVVSRLTKVSTHSEHQIWTKRQFIVRLRDFAGKDFGVRGRLGPGIYRLDVSFETDNEIVKDQRSELFRVVKPKSSLDLASTPMKLLAGEVGYLRVLNFGTVDATFSYLYSFRDAENGSPVPTNQQVVPQILPRVGPGMAGECFEFQVPTGLPDGDYEVGVYVNDSLLSERSRIWGDFTLVGDS